MGQRWRLLGGKLFEQFLRVQGMSSNLVEISSERVDDIPVIVEWLQQIEIAKWIDQKLSQPHGNHQGLSYGQLSVLLLIYIMTQADHR